MVQKIIKIGSSSGVTIPKKQLQELGLEVGDEVEVTIKPKHIDENDQEMLREYRKFKKHYGQTLKNLADR